ncbi:MAG: tRNA 2-thiouridine(34) synthase MnmA [Spirochaetia bacterium]|nr:tRNA 2-thiouridine(34) synthase MnmA [Spirochaetia bacterium]
MGKINSTIAVGLSGGVDSSAALYLLQQEWKIVIGASHDICVDSKSCNDETLGRAGRLCDSRGVPYYRFNMIDEFYRKVITDFAESYRVGKTPNPCVRCNERIRFSLFYLTLQKQVRQDGLLEIGKPLYFATGHYARKSTLYGYPVISKGIDVTKDQSYMLYRINPEILPYILFPLGDRTKKEIVAVAGEQGLPGTSVKESQDICFVPEKYTDFLAGYFGNEALANEGDIIDRQGNVLGRHRGYMHYTIGQRQGLGLSDGPWYVSKVNSENNCITVSRKDELPESAFSISETNWFIPPEVLMRESGLHTITAEVKIRYNSPSIPCSIKFDVFKGGEKSIVVYLDEPSVITPGQSAVVYIDDKVVGGGIINDLNIL